MDKLIKSRQNELYKQKYPQIRAVFLFADHIKNAKKFSNFEISVKIEAANKFLQLVRTCNGKICLRP